MKVVCGQKRENQPEINTLIVLSGNREQFREVMFHTYWYTLIVLRHFNQILVYTDTVIVLQHLHHLLVYADGAATFSPCISIH